MTEEYLHGPSTKNPREATVLQLTHAYVVTSELSDSLVLHIKTKTFMLTNKLNSQDISFVNLS